MRKLSIALISLQVFCSAQTFAKAKPSLPEHQAAAQTAKQDFFNQSAISGIYAYSDFHFSSNTGLNNNSFKGHTNLYALSGDTSALNSGWLPGLSVLHADTRLNTNAFFSPGPQAVQGIKIKNDSLLAHVTRILGDKYAIDLLGMYGHNQVNSHVFLSPGTAAQQMAFAKSSNNNWIASLDAMYNDNWKTFSLRADARVLFSQVNVPTYFLNFQPAGTQQPVNSLRNRATYTMETLEIGHPLTEKLSAFVDGGLVQVPQFTNSRALINAGLINGSMPQLTVDQGGYRLGAGLSYKYQHWILRAEEQYYNASSVYDSLQSIVSLRYCFD